MQVFSSMRMELDNEEIEEKTRGKPHVEIENGVVRENVIIGIEINSGVTIAYYVNHCNFATP